MAAYSAIQEVECASATEFVDAISPRGRYFGRTRARVDWLFRGHSDARYELVPSALRETSRDFLHEIARSAPAHRDDINVNQLLAEAHIASDFYILADVEGLAVPDHSQQASENIHHFVNEIRPLAIVGKETLPADFPQFDFLNRWPPDNLIQLLALAQHHGLPTRLLDWSGNPYCAAYFAAIECKTPAEQIAVWALNFMPIAVAQTLESTERAFRLHTAAVPRAGNRNLHAQDGYFTFVRFKKFDRLAAVDRRPLDAFVTETVKESEFLKSTPAMYHFTLPSSKAGEVLWLLAKEGITGARLFPGFDGVAVAQRERLRWKMPKELRSAPKVEESNEQGC